MQQRWHLVWDNVVCVEKSQDIMSFLRRVTHLIQFKSIFLDAWTLHHLEKNAADVNVRCIIYGDVSCVIVILFTHLWSPTPEVVCSSELVRARWNSNCYRVMMQYSSGDIVHKDSLLFCACKRKRHACPPCTDNETGTRWENVRGYNDILAQLHVWGDCIS